MVLIVPVIVCVSWGIYASRGVNSNDLTWTADDVWATAGLTMCTSLMFAAIGAIVRSARDGSGDRERR
jgi:hypothetical protein